MARKNRAADDEPDTNDPSDPEVLESQPAPVAKLDVTPKSLEAPPTPIKEYIALRVFATIAGPKWDQMAGFVAHARIRKLGPLTMEDWQAEFKKFQEKPVG